MAPDPVVGQDGRPPADFEVPRASTLHAIDDVVLFKVKTWQWRGAVYSDEPGADVNAGHDQPMTTDTYMAHLLPGPDDRDRYLIEAATRLARRLDTTVRELVRGSLRDSHEHAADFAGFRLGIIVRAEDGHETYVAIRITGSVHKDLIATILNRVPGCAPDAWFPE